MAALVGGSQVVDGQVGARPRAIGLLPELAAAPPLLRQLVDQQQPLGAQQRVDLLCSEQRPVSAGSGYSLGFMFTTMRLPLQMKNPGTESPIR